MLTGCVGTHQCQTLLTIRRHRLKGNEQDIGDVGTSGASVCKEAVEVYVDPLAHPVMVVVVVVMV